MNGYTLPRFGSRLSGLVLAAAVLGACGADAGGGGQSEVAGSQAAPAVPASGKVITVEMYTDGTGNYFKPKQIRASSGDVVRFVLKSGVHNVHFVADSNPATTLPTTSDYLQLPGQEFDVTIEMPAGTYYYQCDPHALLGMIGYITVTP